MRCRRSWPPALVAAMPLKQDQSRVRPVPRPTDVVDAYTLYLRGRYAAHKRTPEGLSLAVEYFEQAVERDPGYALAHAGLAECWTLLGFPEFGDLEWSTTAPRARAAALEALRLDPRLAQAHLWLGVVHFLYDWDWAAAEARFRRALQLDPREAIAETWYAMFLGAMRPTRREPPAHPARRGARAAFACRCVSRWAGATSSPVRYEQARDALGGLLKSEPGHRLTTIWLARALTTAGPCR